MKKLLIAMTAVAVGFSAWADGEQTLLNETFEANWTLTGNAWWTYSAEAAEGELTLLDTGKLKLNTGSKVLNAKFAASPKQIPAETGYLFNSQVKFTDPSDTIPELGQYDKFALVVLDNIESVELAAKAGNTVENTTNLFVIAGYGTAGMRAYMLSPAEGIADLDSEWLARDHIIKVKAYADAIDSADETRVGFRVMVDGYICKVLASYAIVDDVIDFTDSIDADGSKDVLETSYLGRVKADFVAGIRKWYNAQELLIANCLGNTLASVDFQGQGTIDDVSLAVAGNEFGPESTVVTFGGYSANAIASITYGGQNVQNGEYTITGDEDFGDTVEIVVTLKSGYALKAGDATYTVSYTFSETTATASKTITLDVFEIKAYADGVAKRSFTEALTAGGTIQLSKAITADDANGEGGFIDIAAEQTVTIDLNGNDIVDIVNAGNLTITDSVGTGRVLENAGISVSNDEGGTLNILGGCFEGAIVGATAKGISGGKFKDKTGLDEGALDDGLAFSDDPVEGYWVVGAATYAVTYNSSANFTIKKDSAAFASGNKLANGTYNFTVEAAEGYQIDSVTVGGNSAELTNGSFTVTVNGGDVAIVVTASLKTFNVALNLTNATVSGVEARAYEYGAEISFTAALAGADYENLTVTIDGAEYTKDGDTYTFTVTGAVTITVTADKKTPAGPTVPAEQGSVSEPDANGNVTVKPNVGVTEITISGTVTGSVTIPSSVEKVTGVAFGQLVITYTSGDKTSVITDAFKAGEDGAIVLNEDGIVNGVPVKPAMAEEAPLVVGSKTTDVAVKTIPGLTYKLMRGTDLKSINVQRDSKTGTGEPVTLTDPEEAERPTKAFYRIHVSR